MIFFDWVAPTGFPKLVLAKIIKWHTVDDRLRAYDIVLNEFEVMPATKVHLMSL